MFRLIKVIIAIGNTFLLATELKISYHVHSRECCSYPGFKPFVAFITTCREHCVSTINDHIQSPNGCTIHMIEEFKAHVPAEFQHRTVQFCGVSKHSRTGCFYVHVISCEQIYVEANLRRQFTSVTNLQNL